MIDCIYGERRLIGIGLILIGVFFLVVNPVYGQNASSTANLNKPLPLNLRDKSLVVERFVSGLSSPISIAFLGNDMLVLERTTGNVKLIRDGEVQPNPILKLNVSNITFEEGLLGVLVNNSTVYLHYTDRDSENKVSNWFYKYTWDGNKLINPVLLKVIHGGSGIHNGGPMITNNKGKVYAVMGDLGNRKGILQNHPSGNPDGTSVIFPLGTNDSYYAIGIRMSLGLAIDPVTGYLWDAENGGVRFDEINLVTPKFNSGWDVIMGAANSSQLSRLPLYNGYKYHDPKFSWEVPIGVTAISFIRSDLFKQYQNSLLVGGFHNGILYELELNENRTGFVFKDPSLSDLVLNKDDQPTIIFGTGFAGITDIKEGPDGMIYVVSTGDGTIYRISPKNTDVK